ncbi:MAG: ABC transporter substrate-binding protein [Thermodesulfobacteriota bacterium]
MKNHATRNPPRLGRSALAALLCLLCLAAPALAADFPLAVTDAKGRQVSVPRRPQRLVVLSGNAADALRILRATDLATGVTERIRENPVYWGSLAALPSVGKWNSPNLEAIAALRPDLVIGYGANPGPELEERLAPLGIPVLRLDLHRLHSLEAEMADLGRILGREAEASAYLEWHRAALARIRDLVGRAGTRPRAYVEGYSDFRVAGPGSGIDEMVRAAGCLNLAETMAIPFAEVTPEWVVAAAPQIVIKAVSGQRSYECADPGLLPRVRERILARPGWSLTPAARDGRVLVIASDLCPGTGAAAGVAHLAAFAHPEVAGRIDPGAVQREYLTRFLGLADQGCYVFAGARP